MERGDSLNKSYLLRELAENGYNVLYGAKKHFATYDIVEKLPGRIAFITLIIGIWQLYQPDFPYSQEVSFVLILASVTILVISQYNGDKEKYKEVGSKLTQHHNDLRQLYYSVSSINKEDYNEEFKKMEEIMNEFYDKSISKQIFLSDWYAHYKFFFQSQYEWINEQKNFSWRDKIPFSFRVASILFIVFVILFILLIR